MKSKSLIPLACSAALLAGCASPTGFVKAVGKALAEDKATAWITVPTPSGTVKYIRVMPVEGQTVTVSPEGAISVRQNSGVPSGSTTIITPDGKVTEIKP